jgi:hypothetical protein
MCPSCARRLVEIDVRLGDSTITMHACSTCDRCWWDRDGRPVDIGTVLALASTSTPTGP